MWPQTGCLWNKTGFLSSYAWSHIWSFADREKPLRETDPLHAWGQENCFHLTILAVTTCDKRGVLHVPIPVWALSIKIPRFVSWNGTRNGNGSKELYEPDLNRHKRPEFQILQRLHDENFCLGHKNVTFLEYTPLSPACKSYKCHPIFISCGLEWKRYLCYSVYVTLLNFNVKWEICNWINANGHTFLIYIFGSILTVILALLVNLL